MCEQPFTVRYDALLQWFQFRQSMQWSTIRLIPMRRFYSPSWNFWDSISSSSTPLVLISGAVCGIIVTIAPIIYSLKSCNFKLSLPITVIKIYGAPNHWIISLILPWSVKDVYYSISKCPTDYLKPETHLKILYWRGWLIVVAIVRDQSTLFSQFA